jgi:DmsE family decaheme c-type cytochrome
MISSQTNLSTAFVIRLLILTIGIAAAIVMPALAQDAAKAAPNAKYTEDGAERCLNCHGAGQMTVMAETPHGNLENPHSPYAQQGCESCHGPGSLHVSRARGGAGFPALLRFKRGEPVAQQNAMCLDCHARDMGELEGMEWSGSLHDTDQITCAGCHKAHATVDPMTLTEEQNKNCARCHDEQITTHSKFADKGIVFDQLTCFDCHDVHQLTGKP